MKPGRELDALVAEKVMGEVNDGMLEQWVPIYSINIAAAFEVVDKLREKGLNFTLGNGKNGNQYQAEFRERTERALYTGKWWFVIEDTASHAICLAALKAVGHEF